MNTKIEIPDGVKVSLKGNSLVIEGEKGSLEKEFNKSKIDVKISEKEIEMTVKNKLKKTKAYTGSVVSHIKNLIKGVTEGYVYKLKIVFKHFPINVAVQGNKVLIKNFAGEKVPRVADILDGVTVEVKGQEIEINGIDKEKVGQTAANIENRTRITGRDIRRFQDGIYITQKG